MLGLGVPQPLVPNFLLHPLSPLLLMMQAPTWARLLIVTHIVIGATGMWRLARRLRVSYPAAALCVVTFLLATPAQNYVLTDFWPSHFIVWTMSPWLLWLAWELLECERGALRFWSITAGLVAGLVLVNTNPGHIVVYGVVVAALLVARRREVLPRIGWLALSAGIAIAIASPNLLQLARERVLFAPGLPLTNLPAPLPLRTAWNVLFGRLVSNDEALPFSRVLFFGGPFAVLCAVACVRFARQRTDLVVAVAVSALLLFTPLLPLPFVSARFQFRDPLTLAAIALAALCFDWLMSSERWKHAAALVFVAQAAAVGSAAWPALSRAWTPDARRAEWFRGATAATPAADRLAELTSPGGRMLLTPALDDDIYDGRHVDAGLGVNALAYRSIPLVNGWFKGVSTDAIWPDERMFYGRIRTPPQLLTSPATLDALGIRYVLADAGEQLPSSLRLRGTVPDRRGSFDVYENVNAWPEAFVVDARIEQAAFAPLSGCANTRLLCTDLSPLAERRAGEQVFITTRGSRMSVRLFAAESMRVLVVSRMFRPGWAASAPSGRLTTVAIAGGLLGVRIPPGVTSVDLRYDPLSLMVSTAVAVLTIAGAMGYVLFSLPLRRIISSVVSLPDPVPLR